VAFPPFDFLILEVFITLLGVEELLLRKLLSRQVLEVVFELLSLS